MCLIIRKLLFFPCSRAANGFLLKRNVAFPWKLPCKNDHLSDRLNQQSRLIFNRYFNIEKITNVNQKSIRNNTSGLSNFLISHASAILLTNVLLFFIRKENRYD